MFLGKGCSLPKVSITRKCVCGGGGMGQMKNTLAYYEKTVNYTKASFVK